MNLSGKWIGEYSQLSGTIQPTPIVCDSFEIRIVDDDGKIEGTGKDTTLDGETFTIKGFYEDGMISFIKKYDRLVFQDDEGAVFGHDDYNSIEIHYAGRYNAKEKVFQGTWEMQIDEERQGLQESFTDEYDRGDWYLRKAQ